LVGAIAVVGGLFASLEWDTPSGPTIVVAALGLFILSLTPVAGWIATRRSHAGSPAE
jgi:zinc transport system permease protein